MTEPVATATVEESLRFGGGVEPALREKALKVLSRMDHRLRSFRADAVEMELSIKERDTASQRTTLEVWIARWPRMVSTSTETDIDKSLVEVRDDMVRQISDAKDKKEPANRHRRTTTP